MRWDQRAIMVWGILGGGIVVPTVALTAEADRAAVDATEIADPSSNTQAQAATGDDSGVRSRAPSSGSLRAPSAIQQFKKAPLPPDAMVQVGPAPTNVTLTPVSPTNIKIEWSPTPGAVRYVVSRNGGPDIHIDPNAGHLQGNRLIYTDVGRRPGRAVTALVRCERHLSGIKEGS